MFNFTVKEFILGGSNATPTLQFYRRGFNLGGSASPSWQDIILSGNTALTLTNALANGLNYVKLFGGTEQNGTPSPDNPIDIVCNNGVLKYGQYGKNLFDGQWQVGIYNTSDGNYNPAFTNRICSFNSMKVLPSTNYTISAEGVSSGWRILFYDQNDSYISYSGDATMTTPSNARYIRFYIANNYTVETAPICQLEQGSTATAYEPYHFGLYTDGTQETVEVHSVNVINTRMTRDTRGLDYWINHKDKMHYGCANLVSWENGRNITTTPNYWNTAARTMYIPCTAGDVFRIKGYNGYSSTPRQWICFVNKDNVVISKSGWISTGSYTAPSNTTYAFVEWGVDDVNTDGWVITRNTALPTDYEPYFNGGSATAENLFKVGTYQDVQDVLSGSVTRNVGIKVFDGTENWQSIVSPYFSLAKSDITPSALPGDNFKSICSHFVRSGSGGTLPEIVAFYWGKSYFSINIDISGSTTVAQFKTWLANQYNAGTPVIVVYPLAEPTTETVTAQSLTTQAGTNIVEITQASINNLGLEVLYKAGVEVTITEVQNAQLSNSVTVTIGG